MIDVGLYLMGEKGLEALRALCSHHGSRVVSYVVTAADEHVQDDYCSAITGYCKDNGIDCHDRKDPPPSRKASIRVAIGWRWLIDDCNDLLVLHDSLLPKYRGFAPLVNMLVNGETEIGVSAIEATKSYDQGPVVGQASVSIRYPIRIHEAIRVVARLYGKVLSDTIAGLQDGTLSRSEQIEGDASYSVWLDEEDYFIDWRWPADKIERFVDAVGFPYLGARSRLAEQIVAIDEARSVADKIIEDRGRHVGKVFARDDGRPLVICGSGLIRVDSIRGLDGSGINIALRSRFR